MSYAYQKTAGPGFELAWNELVRIHLADTTARLHGNQSVKTLLPDEQKTENLFSYAYQEQEEQWRDSWNHAMNIHLAGLPSQNGEIQSAVLPQIESHLTTYADPKEVEAKERAMNIHLAGHSATPEMENTVKPDHDSHLTTYSDQSETVNTVNDSVNRVDLRPRVIIDSGAFTAWSTGKAIDPRDYAEWALDFDKRWRHKMASLEFMNLDVIGDQDASWRNQAILEGLGMTPLPIVTYGVDMAHLDRALRDYDYIALGGLVPHSRDKKKLQTWLDACFSRVMKYKKETGILRRIHLLGITTDWVLKRYPCFSSDSSSWVSCLRFGGGAAAGIKQLPRYKESDAAMAATIHTLRAEIRKYKKMEQEATNLWKTRGITWND
jgi:hypothetical protein